MAMKIVLVLCLLFAATLALCDNPLEELLENVPKEERNDFLKYHITRGYRLSEKGSNVRESKNYIDIFSKWLYEKYGEAVPSTCYFSANEHQQVRDDDCVVCYPKGCVDLCDCGVYPLNSSK